MSPLTFTLRRASVHDMALARARGCASCGSLPGHHAGQADASRRRNGPRKATSRRPITVRLRSKSCPAPGYRVPGTGRRAVVAQGREPLSRRMWGRRPGRPGECRPRESDWRRGIEVEIIVRGRHITVPSRFRQHATAKLAKLEKLDQKAVRIDVEVSKERNPRQSDRRERVELTIRSRGPAIRAEAAAEDRYAALDLALAKLEGRLRRASDRRKAKDPGTVRSPALLGTLTEAASAAPAPQAPASGPATDGAAAPAPAGVNGTGPVRPRTGGHDGESRLVPIQ